MFTLDEIKRLFPYIDEPSVAEDAHLSIVNENLVFPDVSDKDEGLYEIIFAPDPLTGLPSSDLSLLVEGKYSEDVRRFIEEKGIQRPHEDVLRFSDDTDLSLMTSRRSQYGTERLEYIQELQRVAREGLQNSSDSEIKTE